MRIQLLGNCIRIAFGKLDAAVIYGVHTTAVQHRPNRQAELRASGVRPELEYLCIIGAQRYDASSIKFDRRIGPGVIFCEEWDGSLILIRHWPDRPNHVPAPLVVLAVARTDAAPHKTTAGPRRAGGETDHRRPEPGRSGQAGVPAALGQQRLLLLPHC